MELNVTFQLEIWIVLVLAVSFITGQLCHILKKNSLESKRDIRDWFKSNGVSFFVQCITGLGVLEVLMSQLRPPNNLMGWIIVFYAGLNAGIASNSIGTDNQEAKSQILAYHQEAKAQIRAYSERVKKKVNGG